MTSVSQIIPNYFTGGISDQPDELKKPGQLRDCVNAYPSPVNGLVKRPGLELLNELQSQCNGQSIEQQGSWFHFSRQNVTSPAKQDYIGYVSKNGDVSVWRCSDGEPSEVYYTDTEISPNDNEGIAEKDLNLCEGNNYLRHSINDGIKFTTVNNYTFMTNSSVPVSMSRKNDKRDYEAFIEITQLAYSREYLVDIDLVNDDVNSSYTKATEISLTRTQGFGGDNENDPSCPANMREVVTLDAEDGSGTGLVVELESTGTLLGFQDNDGDAYFECRYRHTVDLINGGRDFERGDICIYSNQITDAPDTKYTIEVTKTEKVYSSADYQVTGVLTPSNGDEVATIKGILNNLRDALVAQTPLLRSNIEIVGNGLYITNSEPFTVTTSEKDLMNVLSNTDNELENPYCIVNNVSRLPIECKDGLLALVSNSFSNEDDYYVQFRANYGDVTNNSDDDAKETAATGYWEEVSKPGTKVKLNSGTMPQALVYTRMNNKDSFIVAPVAWKDRTCGDESFNPSFENFTITNLLFYRNRLCALSQENVVMTRAGELFNWFPASALASAPSDPIDISAATDYSAVLQDGLVGNNTLVLFSDLQQFQLTTDSDVLSPSTAKILEISRYNYSSNTRPFFIGTNYGFISDRGARAKVYEMSDVFREGASTLVERSLIIAQSFPTSCISTASSPEDELMLFAAPNSKTVWLNKSLKVGNELKQDAWVKWVFPYRVFNHFILDDIYYAVMKNPDNNKIYLGRIQLEKDPTKGPFLDLWEKDVEDSGVPYTMKVKFPTVNVFKREQSSFQSDTTSSLVVHRLRYNFGDIGTYNFEIQRDGYDDYNVLYESRYMDEYKADAEPLVPEVEQTIPVYTRNTAFNVTLKSDYNQPLILHSMRWEGDYNPRYYKRV